MTNTSIDWNGEKPFNLYYLGLWREGVYYVSHDGGKTWTKGVHPK